MTLISTEIPRGIVSGNAEIVLAALDSNDSANYLNESLIDAFIHDSLLRSKVCNVIVQAPHSDMAEAISKLFFHWEQGSSEKAHMCLLSFFPQIIYAYILSVKEMTPAIALEACLAALYTRDSKMLESKEYSSWNQFTYHGYLSSSVYRSADTPATPNSGGVVSTAVKNSDVYLSHTVHSIPKSAAVAKGPTLIPLGSELSGATRDVLMGVALRRFREDLGDVMALMKGSGDGRGCVDILTAFVDAFTALLATGDESVSKSIDTYVSGSSSSHGIFLKSSTFTPLPASILMQVLGVAEYCIHIGAGGAGSRDALISKARVCVLHVHVRAMELLDAPLLFETSKLMTDEENY